MVLEAKIWALSVLITIGLLLFPGPHGGQNQGVYVTYIFISISIYVCWKSWVTLISPILNQHCKISSSFLTFHICNSLLQPWIISFSLCLIYLLICAIVLCVTNLLFLPPFSSCVYSAAPCPVIFLHRQSATLGGLWSLPMLGHFTQGCLLHSA